MKKEYLRESDEFIMKLRKISEGIFEFFKSGETGNYMGRN